MEERTPVLVVDDDEAFRRQLGWSLRGAYDPHEAADRESALAALRERFYPLILLDLHLTQRGDDLDGLEVLRWVSRNTPGARVILLTGESDPRLAAETLRWGAWDHVPKPVDPEELLRILGRACRLTAMEASAGPAIPALERLGSLVTASPEMARVLRAARQLASTRLPVLVLGPAGCGKTAVALEILALQAPQGISAPHGASRITPAGTLPDLHGDPIPGWVLEQVESLPRDLQEDLQDLLDREESGREGNGGAVGGPPPRIVATARADLLPLARRGRFLPALARRFETARLRIPGLADRLEDLPWIVRHALAGISNREDRPALRLTPEAEQLVREMASGMEVRDLALALSQAARRSGGAWISAEVLLGAQPHRSDSLRVRRSRLEASAIREALARHQGNVSHAARDLGVSRPTLHDLMRKHALDPSRFRNR